MPGGILQYATIAAYESLIEHLIDVADKSACGYVKLAKPILACFRGAGNGIVTFDSYLYLRNWGQKEQVNILVRAREIIRRDSPPVLVRSTVHVSYFSADRQNPAHLQSMHFDYGDEQACHPVFHVQSCPEMVELSQDDAEALEFEFPKDIGDAICFKYARIPTSDMTFSSVLLCLAADHMRPEFFSEFMKSVRDVHRRMPLPSFKRLQSSIANEPNHLRSFHWYAHMWENLPGTPN
jgi:hypothetical protein